MSSCIDRCLSVFVVLDVVSANRSVAMFEVVGSEDWGPVWMLCIWLELNPFIDGVSALTCLK